MESGPSGALKVRPVQEADLVPKDFRKHPIEVSIAARNLPRTVRLLGDGNFCVVIQVRYAGKTTFETLVTTERRCLETFPSFTEKASFPALDMPHSNRIAYETKIRAEIFAGKSSLGVVETTLGALIWRTVLSLKLEASGQSHSFRRLSRPNGKHVPPEVLLNVESYHCPPEDSPEHSINVHVRASISERLGSDAKDVKLSYSVARANRIGDWTTLFRSEPRLGKHLRMEDTTIPLHAVLGGESDRQLRFALHSFHRSTGGRMEGFVIVRIQELENIQRNGGGRAANLPWTQMEDATLDGGMEFRSITTGPDGATSLTLHFKDRTQVLADQVAVTAETTETGVVRTICGKIARLSIGRGNSLISSESERASATRHEFNADTASSEGLFDSPVSARRVHDSHSDLRTNSTCTRSSSDLNNEESASPARASALYLPKKPQQVPNPRRAFSFRQREPSLPIIEMEVRFPGE